MLFTIIVSVLIIQRIHSFEKKSLIWLCLERCGETHQEILDYTKIIIENAQVCHHYIPYNCEVRQSITDLSFEKYDLGYNSSLVINDFTDVYSILNGTKGYMDKEVRMFPMVTSATIEKMREVFAKPEPFIDSLIAEAEKFGYTGYNIDFEPEHDVIAQDRPLYNKFLDLLSTKLLEKGILLNVDVATWSVLYDYKELNKIKNIETLITMETYVKGWDLFVKLFQEAYTEIDHGKLGIGLDSEYDMSEEDLQKRFDYISQYDVEYLAVWRYKTGKFDTGSLWWKLMFEYLDSK